MNGGYIYGMGIINQRSITAGYHLVEPVQSWNQWKLDT